MSVNGILNSYANSRISLDDIPSGPQALDGLILLSSAYTPHGYKCGGGLRNNNNNTEDL